MIINDFCLARFPGAAKSALQQQYSIRKKSTKSIKLHIHSFHNMRKHVTT